MTVLCLQGEEVDITFIKTSLLERLADDNLGVVSEVLSFGDVSFLCLNIVNFKSLHSSSEQWNKMYHSTMYGALYFVMPLTNG